MEYGIIVTGHGHFAKGITSAVELIMGKPENYTEIDFPAGTDANELEKAMNAAVSEFKNREIIIMCDLLGGSPCQTAIRKAVENPHIHVIYGVNLGMILEICARVQYGGSEGDLLEGIVELSTEHIGIIDLQHLPQ